MGCRLILHLMRKMFELFECCHWEMEWRLTYICHNTYPTIWIFNVRTSKWEIILFLLMIIHINYYRNDTMFRALIFKMITISMVHAIIFWGTVDIGWDHMKKNFMFLWFVFYGMEFFLAYVVSMNCFCYNSW